MLSVEVFTRPRTSSPQLALFVDTSNTRWMRVLGCRPSDWISADVAAMMSLPAVAPATGWATSLGAAGTTTCWWLTSAEDFRARIDAAVSD